MDQPALHVPPDQRLDDAEAQTRLEGWVYRVVMPERAEIFGLEAELRSLCANMLDANAFASADFLMAATRHFPEAVAPDFIIVWAESRTGGERKLVGMLAVTRRRGLSGGLLRSWNHPFATLTGLALHKDHAEAALAALLRHLARERQPATALCLNKFPEEGPLAETLRRVVTQLGLQTDTLSRNTRAVLTLPPGVDAETDRRSKSRRRQRRRLAEQGALSFRVLEGYDAIRPGLERFLALEASGWKGERGTALMLDPVTVNFSRAMIWSAARNGGVWIGELLLEEAVIASILILVAGDRAFLWKMAHNETYQAFSPGALLLLDLNAWLIADNRLRLIDSCTETEHAVVDHIWRERTGVVDLTVALDPLHAPAYQATLTRERLRRDMRMRVKRIYHRLRSYAAAS